MNQKTQSLRSGDLVEVKSAEEIAATLDADGAVDQLPFMPEMIEHLGKRFRVAKKVVIICSSGTKTGSTLRSFHTNDVVLLEGLRCSGANHDGCQKACTLLWREAWLRKVDSRADKKVDARTNATANRPAPSDPAALLARLKTKASEAIYFCQASELLRATKSLGKMERYSKVLTEMQVGNCGPIEMARRVGIFLFWKIRRALLGPYARGNRASTPAGTLGLQAGELVQVKPMQSIAETLDGTASNRGLWFSPNMRLLCGHDQRVEKRIEKLIVDGTGEMRKLKNTVFLEGSHCSCPHIALGGCERQEYVYWREIWLERCGETGTLEASAMNLKEQEQVVESK